MKLRDKQVLSVSVISLCLLLTALTGPLWAQETEWIIFQNDLPQDIQRIDIPLTFDASKSVFYDSNAQEIQSTEMQGKDKKDNYKQQLDFGIVPDGSQYIAYIRDAEGINIISSDSERLCSIRIVRISENSKPVIIKEGNYFLGKNIEFPIEMPAGKLGIPTKEPVAGTAAISLYSNSSSTYRGRFDVRIPGTLTGSTSAENAFINVYITCRNSPDMKDRNVTVTVKPFEDQMASASGNGEISDILTAGSAKLVVEKIASDSSRIVLALLSGSLIQAKIPGASLELGKPFPEFARVELVNRRFVTLSDLEKEAGPEGYVVLIFGDFKRAPSMPGFYDPRAQAKTLSLDESMIVNTLKKDCDKKIIIGFICQQLALADLYEKWLGRELDFCVLSEFSNPLDIQFIIQGMQHYGGFRQPGQGETLRGQLGLPSDNVITALINGQGELVFLNTNASGQLSASLVQISNLIKEKKNPGT